MTLSTTDRSIEHPGPLSIGAILSIPFRFLQNSHIRAYSADLADGANQLPLANGTDYVLSGADALPGGSATLGAGGAIGPTRKLVFYREVDPVNQQTSYPEGDPFPSRAHERALDKLTMIVQELKETLARAVIAPIGVTPVPAFPAPEEGEFLSWSSGQLVNAPGPTLPSGVVASEVFDVVGAPQSLFVSSLGVASLSGALVFARQPGAEDNLLEAGVEWTLPSTDNITLATPVGIGGKVTVIYVTELTSRGNEFHGVGTGSAVVDLGFAVNNVDEITVYIDGNYKAPSGNYTITGPQQITMTSTIDTGIPIDVLERLGEVGPTGATGPQGPAGEVVSTGGSTPNAIPRFSDTSGDVIKTSLVTIDDSGNVVTPGNVDGRDVSADGTAQDAHIAATAAHGATGAVVGTTNAQTLTNKTLIAPVIATIVNTGTLTLPTSTDTLVGRDTTDTLTNKTLTTPTIASFVNAAHNHNDAAGGGNIPETAITDGALLARLAANETISGAWTFPAAGLFLRNGNSKVYSAFDTQLNLQATASVFIEIGGSSAVKIFGGGLTSFGTNPISPTNGLVGITNSGEGYGFEHSSSGQASLLTYIDGSAAYIGVESIGHDLDFYTSSTTFGNLTVLNSGGVRIGNTAHSSTYSVLNFANATNSGSLAWSGSTFTTTVAGVTALTLTSTQLATTFGTAAAPGYTFLLDEDTGVYRAGSNQCAIAAGGVQIINFRSTGIQVPDAIDFTFNGTTGTKLGTRTTQKIGFWNATPIVQPASANQAAVALDLDVTGVDTVDKAAIDANFTAVQTLVNQLRSDLVAAGLIKGAA